MELRQTAVHEAGHVVVGFVLGFAPKEVALTHDEAGETGVYGVATGPHPIYGYHHRTRRDEQATLRDACIENCAGLAAEHVIYGVPLATDNENAQGDFGNIIDLESSGRLRTRWGRGGSVGDDQTWAFIDRRLKEAARLVRRHRGTIERFAAVLVERTRLGAAEVRALLEEWGVRPG